MLRSDHRTPFTARGTTKRVNETLDVYPMVCNSDIRILLLCYFSRKAKACVIKRARPVLQSRGLPPCFPLSCSKRISPMFCKARSLCCRDDRRVAAFCPPESDVPGTVACSSCCFGSRADSDGKARTTGSSVWRKGRAGGWSGHRRYQSGVPSWRRGRRENGSKNFSFWGWKWGSHASTNVVRRNGDFESYKKLILDGLSMKKTAVLKKTPSVLLSKICSEWHLRKHRTSRTTQPGDKLSRRSVTLFRCGC